MRNQPTRGCLDTTINQIRRQLQNQHIPINDETFPELRVQWMDHFAAHPNWSHKLQHTLTEKQDEARHRSLLDSLQQQPARWSTLISAAEPHAAAWFGSYARRDWVQSRLTHNQWSMAMRLRLGLPLMESPNQMEQVQCACHKTWAMNDTLTHHILCCKQFSSQMIERHNLLVQVVKGLVNRGGVYATVEPGDQGGQKRPDLLVYAASGVIQVDVSVTHPGMPSRNGVYHVGRLATAGAREQEKRRQYHQCLLENPGDEFVPFVLEAPGGVGTAAREFCQQMARWISDQPGEVPYDTAMSEVMTEISTALQRGNAAVLSAGLIARRIQRGPVAQSMSPDERVQRALTSCRNDQPMRHLVENLLGARPLRPSRRGARTRRAS